MGSLSRSARIKILYVTALVAIAAVVGWRTVASRREPPAIDLQFTGRSVQELLLARARWKYLQSDGLPPGDVADPPWEGYLTPEVARLFFGIRQSERYDPFCYVVHAPDMDWKRNWREHPRGEWRLVTNALGMRRGDAPAAERPDLRILATGDSHTDGVCWNEEAWPMVLEAEIADRHPGLAVEVLNTGKGGYTLHNFRGVLEKYLELEPHAFIVCIFGGNDFREALSLCHYFAHTARPTGTAAYSKLLRSVQQTAGPALAQSFLSYKYFEHQPDQIDVALECAVEVTSEIVERCRAAGVLPILVYLPALPEVRFDDERELCEELLDELELERAALAVHDRLADGLIAHLRATDVDVLDLRPVMAAGDERLYWHRDHHVNVEGHRRIAAALAPLVEQQLMADR